MVSNMQVDENSPSPQLSPTAQCVGREFVRQYYTLLAEAPRYVHRFYSNESIFLHGSDTDEVIGQEAIRNKIKDMNFRECRTRIRGLDAHETLGKGVVVQVVGEITVNEGPMRRFVQTFVLAPQSEKKYYVHNDIFRYEDEVFAEKLGQENGAPADPEAVGRIAPQLPQPNVSNGNSHDEIASARYSVQQPTLQQQQLATSGSPHLASSQISGTTFGGVSTASSIGSVPSGQPTVDGTSQFGWIDESSVMTASNIQPNSGTTSYAPMPQRVQQPAQSAPPSAHAPTTATAVSSNLQSAAPPEPTLTPLSVEQTLPRPQSVDKADSPVPLEEHEDVAETTEVSWASKVANKPSSRAQHHPTQQSQHVTPMPGTSAPTIISPTAGNLHAGGQTAHDFNRPSAQQQANQPNRQGGQYRGNRPNTAYGGGGSQDARASPVPVGQPAPFSGGGSSRPRQNIDSYPNEQQIYVRNLPPTMSENELKELFESLGHTGVVQANVRPQKHSGNPAYGFVAFDSVATAQKLIQMKTIPYRETDIVIDVKRPMADRSGGGGSGNFQNNSQRQFPNSGMNTGGGGMGRPNQNIRGGTMGQRGGSRMGPSGGSANYASSGGGNRQPNARTFHSNMARATGPHPQ